jgi:hypothetical protein
MSKTIRYITHKQIRELRNKPRNERTIGENNFVSHLDIKDLFERIKAIERVLNGKFGTSLGTEPE